MMSPPTFVYRAAFCAAVNSALLGYDIGEAGGAMFLAKDQLQLSDFDTEVILSTLNFCAIPGALLSRPVSDNYGRTKTLALASTFFLCGSLIMASAGGFTMLLVGRMLLDLHKNLNEVASNLLEICQDLPGCGQRATYLRELLSVPAGLIVLLKVA